jgi:putative FmdB family regulatory protein
MPNYGFECKTCGKGWDVFLPISRRNEKQKCECGGDLSRTLDMPAIHGLSSTIGVNGWGVAPPPNSDKAKGEF